MYLYKAIHMGIENCSEYYYDHDEHYIKLLLGEGGAKRVIFILEPVFDMGEVREVPVLVS